jgi:hypothetical protein
MDDPSTPIRLSLMRSANAPGEAHYAEAQWDLYVTTT